MQVSRIIATVYNGKELENYTIGSSYLGTLDYGARHYDARNGVGYFND